MRTFFAWQSPLLQRLGLLSLCASPNNPAMFQQKIESSEKSKYLRQMIRRVIDQEVRQEIIYLDTVSGPEIVIVESPEEVFSLMIPETDAVITRVPQMPFFFMPADCQPIYIWAPKQRVAALVHGHWRTLGELPARVIRTMENQFSVNPRDMFVSIGPSIGKCCYGLETKSVAQETDPDWQPFLEHNRGTTYLDLVGFTVSQLTAQGIPTGQIETSNLCTCCTQFKEKHIFPSYYRDHNRARFLAVMMIP